MPPPDDQWEVHFDDKRVGYKAWDQRVALSYAKAEAKKNKPSTIIVHDRSGKPAKQIEYPVKGNLVEKIID